MERINIDPQIKKKVFEKFHGRCFYCGRQLTWAETTIDHVVPLAKGGKNNVENFVTACCECNVLKGDKSIEDFKLFIYSLMANALRYLDRDLYNFETGELLFFGERNKNDFKEISAEDAHHLNNIMKPSMNRFRKYISSTSATVMKQRLSMDDIKSIPIDNPYENGGPITKKPFEDDDWKNDNTLAEKAFVAIVGEETNITPPYENISSDDTSKSKNLVNTTKIEKIEKEEIHKEEIPNPNFVIINPDEESVIIHHINFILPKGLSHDAKVFLEEVKKIIETENLSTEESMRTYYNKMDKNLISDKQYAKISKELIKKEIINKHKNFRPRVIVDKATVL